MFLRVTLEASNCNAYITASIFGHSSPATAIGFVEALSYKLGTFNDKKEITPLHFEKNLGVAVIYHYYEDNNNFSYRKSAQKNGGSLPNTLYDMPSSNQKISLIFSFEEDNISAEGVLKAVQTLRYGGGKINAHTIEVVLDEDAENVMKDIPPGFIMAEHKDGDNLTPNEAVKLLHKNKRKESGYVTMTLMGYLLKETPEVKPFSNFGKEHAFAEPLIGLTEFTVLRRKHYKDLITDFGWKAVKANNIIKFTTKEL